MKTISLKLISVYKKFISPFLRTIINNSNCRFNPTCSEYAYEVIEKHGFLKGSFYSIKRVIRCNPLKKSGFDPVK